jgi:hypothetical protein
MEELVRGHEKHLILRLPQVVGISENKFTLLNYFKNNIELGLKFKALYNCYRNFIDIDHVVYISSQIIRNYEKNLIINIANPKSILTTEILKKFEIIINKKAWCEFVDGSLDNYKIDVSQMLKIVDCSVCQFDEEYCSRLIQKYYSPI